MQLVLTNPYAKAQRHVIQTYVSEEDWVYFETVIGIKRGVAANMLAALFQKAVKELKKANATRNNEVTAEVIRELLS